MRRPIRLRSLAGLLSALLPVVAAHAQPAMFRGDPAHRAAQPEAGPASLALDWHLDTGGKVRATPVVGRGMVVVGSEDGVLYAVAVEDGGLHWMREIGGPITASAAIAGELVVAVGGDGRVHALDCASGRTRWVFEPGEALEYFSYPDDPRSWDFYASSPVVVDDSVYVGSGDGHVYALALEDGRERWRFRTEAVVRATPAVADGVVYAGGMDGRLYALHAESGELLWSFDTEGSRYFPVGEVQSSPAVADGKVLFGSRDGRLYCLDAASGKQEWRFDHQGSWVITSPAVADGVVFAGSSDGEFFQAVSLSDGSELWRFDTQSRVFSSPVVAGGLVYFGTWDGALMGLDVRDGRLHAATSAENAILSSPLVVGERLFVGSDESRLYALTGPAFEVSEVPAVVEVGGEIRAAMVGRYESADGQSFVVRETGDGLELQWRDRRLSLLPLSETDFVLREGKARVRFVRGADGTVTRLEWIRGGESTPAERQADDEGS